MQGLATTQPCTKTPKHQNAGIGYHTALAVASRGGRLVMGCRDAGKGQAAREAIIIMIIIITIIIIIIIIIIIVVIIG